MQRKRVFQSARRARDNLGLKALNVDLKHNWISRTQKASSSVVAWTWQERELDEGLANTM